MKKNIVILFFIMLIPYIFAEELYDYEQIYLFKMIAFHKKLEVYCTFTPIGYYKYETEVNKQRVYLTYEGKIFFKESLWDENLVIFKKFYPTPLWCAKDGSISRLKKKYAPVIDENKKRKHYPFGFGLN